MDGSGVELRAPVARARSAIRDIQESRELIEVHVVKLAYARLTSQSADKLRAAAARRATWADNVTSHVALAATTENLMLQRLVQMHMDLLANVHLRDHYQNPRGAADLLAEHAGIAEAVIARNAERAEGLMRQHLSHTLDAIGAHPGDAPEPSSS